MRLRGHLLALLSALASIVPAALVSVAMRNTVCASSALIFCVRPRC